MNPMELYHNQVTRTQGPFSLRMFHRSWGLMMIQANIDGPLHAAWTFPRSTASSRRFARTQYDVVGISVDHSQHLQSEEDVRADPAVSAQRRRSSSAGTSPTCPTWHERIDADHIVRGEGVRWFRRFLGEDDDQPHPPPADHLGLRHAQHGRHAPRERRGDVAATVIPSVGCPLGCNFCSTSAMFGGKGKSRQLLPDRRRAVRRHVPARSAR